MTDHAHCCFLFFNHLLSANTRFLSPVLRQVTQDCPAGQRLRWSCRALLDSGDGQEAGALGDKGQSSLPTAGCGWRQLAHTLSSPWDISSGPSAGLGPAPASAAACSLSYLGPSMEPRGRDAGWSWNRAPGRMGPAPEGCEGRTRGQPPVCGPPLALCPQRSSLERRREHVLKVEPCPWHTEPAFPRHCHSG